MPSCSELARQDEDREADVHRHRCDSLGHASGQAGLWGELCAVTNTHEALLAVIRDVHSQHADDLCWMDIDRIFAAAGLPVPDRRVGGKAAMLKNCERFIDGLCQGGGWKSYRELEAQVADLESQLATAQTDRDIFRREVRLMSEKIGRACLPLASARPAVG